MEWKNKLQNLFSKKEVSISGGMEILRKLVSPELSASGQLEKYRKSLYVFACISKIAQKVASVDFQLYRITNSQGDTKEIMTHPILDLIYKVNPFQTKMEFMEYTMINLKCTGEAFWYKVRNNSGKVVELWNLRPDLMDVLTDPVNYIKGYKLRKNDGSKVFFETQDIIQLKYPDPLSQYRGLSPIHPASRRVQTEEYATTWQADFFLNSARPDGLIKNKEAVLTKEQKDDIRESWNKRHGGLKNSYKVAILEGGLDYQLISLSQREMDYIESLKFTRDDILVAFQVPKPIVAVLDDVNRANSETALAIFLGETIKPELVRITEKLNEQLVYEDFGEEFFLDFDDPTPENRELQLKEYESGLQNGYLMINEVRQKEGLAPIRGGWSFYLPLTMVPMGGLSSQDQKSLIKKIGENSDENEKIITEHNKPKQYDFKGRFWLKQKFLIKESLKDGMEKALSKKPKSKKPKAKELKPLLNKEVRDVYAEYIIKKIDESAKPLIEASNKFFDEQKRRVIKALEKKKSLTEKLKVSQIFSVSKEKKLTAAFILPYIEQYLKDAGLEALNMLAPQEDFTSTAKIQRTIKDRAEFFAESVGSTTLQKLDTTLAEGINQSEGIRELTDRVSAVYEEFPMYRSEMIARTEATNANNEGLLEGYKQSGVATHKEWIATMDGRTRDEHMALDGEIVKLDENFSNGLPYPQEPNCRCVTGPAFEE